VQLANLLIHSSLLAALLTLSPPLCWALFWLELAVQGNDIVQLSALLLLQSFHQSLVLFASEHPADILTVKINNEPCRRVQLQSPAGEVGTFELRFNNYNIKDEENIDS